MSNAAENLRESINELGSSKGVKIETLDLGPEWDWAENKKLKPADLTETMGYHCPASHQDLLALPHSVRVTWSAGARVGGAINIGNPFLTVVRVLDQPLQEIEIQSHIRLADCRILDEMNLPEGAHYTLVPIVNETLGETLFYFDTYELYELSLSANAYLGRVSMTKGIRYWPWLYAKEPKLEVYQKEVLQQGLNFLQATFPQRNYSELLEVWNRIAG